MNPEVRTIRSAAAHAASPSTAEPSAGTLGPRLAEAEFRRIRELVRAQFGIELGPHKRTLVINRLSKYVAARGFRSYTEFLDEVEADASHVALDNLASLISVNHTCFFREETHFEFLKARVLPGLAFRPKQTNDYDLRVWCAAAATGQEAYSLMMVLLEHFGTRYDSLDAGLLATDLSTKALERGAAGIYSEEELEGVPPDLRRRYFRKLKDARHQVLPRLRSEVLFRTFNLVTGTYSFKKPFHVIFCRNVLMFFDAQTRHKVVESLYRCTAPGGYLFTGHAEAIDRQERNFEWVAPAIYRRPVGRDR